ncbi:hypothetical protein D7V94_13600 [Parablautia intestinalis]|uniref:Uncharacterized protein n=1 Tax=Parablautia intestinalis TaxID=2320100 RepID=A0A3A9AFP2_9FIRM|nr:hypothetical protein [Parablautia intestinalis]RKI90460.1 hypothetical protein D7V94_13600 [Parablautia intestinalis]
MYHQMSIFDFIERIPQSEQDLSLPQFEELFDKVKNPVIRCANCLCQYCANNAEELWRKVEPAEMKEPCFNCDECQVYNGDFCLTNQQKSECVKFIISDYGAKKNRKRMRIIKNRI